MLEHNKKLIIKNFINHITSDKTGNTRQDKKISNKFFVFGFDSGKNDSLIFYNIDRPSGQSLNNKH